MTNIETVRLLTGNNEISDDFISFYLDSTEKFILGYCNLKKLPPELEPTFLQIAAAQVKANCSGAVATLGEGIKTVASIADGNQSIAYQAGATGGKQFISQEDFIAAYGPLLDRYRKMVVDRTTQPYRTLGSRCLHDSSQHRNRHRW